jgi:hypothetical protein
MKTNFFRDFNMISGRTPLSEAGGILTGDETWPSSTTQTEVPTNTTLSSSKLQNPQSYADLPF